MAIETEIKLKIADPSSLRSRLSEQGFVKVKDRYFEDNVLFDFPAHPLRERGCGLRVRTIGDRATLTFKGPTKLNSKFKSREEIEISTTDGEALKTILSRIGLSPMFRYQKYRTEYAHQDHPDHGTVLAHVLATIDETPIGPYLELEGDETTLPPVIAQLGYTEADLIKSTYITIYRCYCEVNGLAFGDMVFDH